MQEIATAAGTDLKTTQNILEAFQVQTEKIGAPLGNKGASAFAQNFAEQHNGVTATQVIGALNAFQSANGKVPSYTYNEYTLEA